MQLWRGNAWQYPVCFITNGGGVTEDTKAAQLSTWLGVPVHGNQVLPGPAAATKHGCENFTLHAVSVLVPLCESFHFSCIHACYMVQSFCVTSA